MTLSPLVLQANALALPLADRSVHCVVTSPPYWNLRDYGVEGQLGLEPTPEAYVANMVAVFREVRRVLRDDGTLWLNIGDSYANDAKGPRGAESSTLSGQGDYQLKAHPPRLQKGYRDSTLGIKRKDLVGIPWRLAFALQADGWYLRQDIIWHKPSPMPTPTRDRCTTAHEYIFLLTKSPRYYFDTEAIAEPCSPNTHSRGKGGGPKSQPAGSEVGVRNNSSYAAATAGHVDTRNKRSVWKIASEGCKEAHFATYPTRLVEPCILAGTSARGCCPECGAGWVRVVEKQRVATRPGTASKVKVPQGWDTRKGTPHTAIDHRRPTSEVGNRDPERHVRVKVGETWVPGCKCGIAETVPAVVFDVFHGAGTTGMVADRLGRRYIGTELNAEYLPIFGRRLAADRLKREKVRTPRARSASVVPAAVEPADLFALVGAGEVGSG